MIEIRHLCKTFHTGGTPVPALTDVSLTVNDGEIFGIIGLSGAGKSTLVRCINLLERPDSGEVIVNGKDLTRLSRRELLQVRQGIGMIFQGYNLLLQRNVIGNVCYPLEIARWQKEKARARAMELLELVGLAEKAKAYPAQLSGGQKQRVAIARALATSPKVLLCDEATSALDPATTASILALLKEINRRLGVTLVVITHQMSVIDEICDRVAVLDHSRVAEIGNVSEVYLSPECDRAISAAEKAAKSMGDEYISVEHLMIGIFAAATPAIKRIFSDPVLREELARKGYFRVDRRAFERGGHGGDALLCFKR